MGERALGVGGAFHSWGHDGLQFTTQFLELNFGFYLRFAVCATVPLRTFRDREVHHT
jgi:hypothetical protein